MVAWTSLGFGLRVWAFAVCLGLMLEWFAQPVFNLCLEWLWFGLEVCLALFVLGLGGLCLSGVCSLTEAWTGYVCGLSLVFGLYWFRLGLSVGLTGWHELRFCGWCICCFAGFACGSVGFGALGVCLRVLFSGVL